MLSLCTHPSLRGYAGHSAGSVLRSLVLNLAHQHTKVRAITLQALFSLLAVEKGGERLGECSKEIKKVILNDKSSDVRKRGY